MDEKRHVKVSSIAACQFGALDKLNRIRCTCATALGVVSKKALSLILKSMSRVAISSVEIGGFRDGTSPLLPLGQTFVDGNY